VSEDNPVTIPLRGLPRIGDLSVSVIDGATEPYAWVEENVTPREDARYAPKVAASALRSESSFVARVRVPGIGARDPIGRGLVILLDTSASRAPDFGDQLRLVHDVTKHIARSEPEARLSVAAFDQSVVPAYDGPMRGFDDAAVERLRTRGALGASNL